MSRTYRRKNEKWTAEWYATIRFNPSLTNSWWETRVRKQFPGWTDERIFDHYLAKFYSDAHSSYCVGAPKWFRQIYNRRYRRINERYLRRSLQQETDFVEVPFKHNVEYEWW